MPSGGKRENSGRKKGSKIATPREVYHTRLNIVEYRQLLKIAKNLGFNPSQALRWMVGHFAADQEAMELDLAALRAIEDIMRVEGLASKGAAVSVAVRHYKKSLIGRMVKERG